MPDEERRVIWGMMVVRKVRRKFPFSRITQSEDLTLRNTASRATERDGSPPFLDQERQLFGAPGGIMHDWDLKTNIDGIYAAGDQLYASDCAGFACATGYYAGRKASAYAGAVAGDFNRAMSTRR